MKSEDELFAGTETESIKDGRMDEEELEQVAGGKKRTKFYFDPPKTVYCPKCGTALAWCGETLLKCWSCETEFNPW